jgi:hypothetical protein
MTQNDRTANPMSSPTAASTTWKEELEPGEHELFERFAHGVITARQRKIAQRTTGKAGRGLHFKIHAGLKAEFKVLRDLPEHARFGVFAEPRVFQCLVRFSNGESFGKPDKKPQPRGIAIKLFGVSGPKLLEDQKEAVTQDFLATSHSVTSGVRHVRQFMAFLEATNATEEQTHRLFFILRRKLGFWESARILIFLLRTVLIPKVPSMATEHYSSPAPIKFGPYAVRFAVRPAPETRGLAPGTKWPAKRPQTDNFLREELADRLRKGDLNFDFLVQFYVNERHTPIEDTSIPWKQKHAPFVKVAELRIPKCNLSDPDTAKLSQDVDKLSFNPWHAIEDHRPLGNVMRARKVAYLVSAKFRQHAPEPPSLPLHLD